MLETLKQLLWNRNCYLQKSSRLLVSADIHISPDGRILYIPPIEARQITSRFKILNNGNYTARPTSTLGKDLEICDWETTANRSEISECCKNKTGALIATGKNCFVCACLFGFLQKK
jgi:hypothetical protein